jgi:hypothetical protein
MEKKTNEKKMEVKIQPICIDRVNIEIIGKTPLLMDKFPEEAMEQILAKQTGVAKGNKRKTRDTAMETHNAIHRTAKGVIGFPVDGFKKGMMESTSFIGDKFFSKKLVSGAVKIMNAEDGLIPINFKKQDVLKHNIGSNIKFTPQFHGWSCRLVIDYDKNNISAQDIITCLNYAGFMIGVGSWRPHCSKGGSGSFGMYEVKQK